MHCKFLASALLLTCEMRSPTVTANWLTVPKPPLRVSGEISEMYMGTRDVFRPAGKSKFKSIP